MAKVLYPELKSAINEAVTGEVGQSREFRSRFRRLIENAASGNMADDDVLDVIELVTLNEGLED